MFEIQPLLTLISLLADRRHHARSQARAHPDAGYSTETVIVTALLAALAIAAVAVVAAKVLARANAINVGN